MTARADPPGFAADRDTFPKLLEHAIKQRGDRPAFREKHLGIWQTWTWRRWRDDVHAIAAGLLELGAARGTTITVTGDNRPLLYGALCAAQCIGAIPVPLYQDAVAEEMAYVIDHAEAGIAFAEDQEQVDKLLAAGARTARLGRIIYDDPRGLRDYDHARLTSLESLMAMGREALAKDPERVRREIAKGKADDIGVMLYTSGTTGKPKGVMLTYANVMVTAANAVAFDRLTDRDEILAYLPMAWVGDHIFSYGEALVAGFCVACPESGATVLTDLREIGPTFFFAPPRIFENLLTQVTIRMEDAGALKRRMFRYFMDHARRVGIDILDGKPVGAADRLLYRLGELLVYGPLKNVLGLSRMRVGYTAGEAIGPDLFAFYRSLGLNLKQLYGMTEASVFICLQPDGQIKVDTVGPAAPDVAIRLADNGEVLVKSPGVFKLYYKNEAATAEAKTSDGWLRTGDAGVFDADGHLKIIDRAKDVGRLRDGTLFAPKYIENKLKFFAFIKEAVAFGAGRDMATAFINIDLEATGNWAEKRGIAYASYQELAAKPEVYDLVADCVAQVNRDLAADPALAGSQVRRFLILHKELDADDGELTRTRKVRRSFIAERYQSLVEGLYGDAPRAHIATDVIFEDGRKGRLEADLAIRDMPAARPQREAAE
ncbi:MAG: AMP-binding protein [Alphaproteobacteria bacterium]|nr:AMP-binding protein [Alphaproteobacteria bacterium]